MPAAGVISQDIPGAIGCAMQVERGADDLYGLLQGLAVQVGRQSFLSAGRVLEADGPAIVFFQRSDHLRQRGVVESKRISGCYPYLAPPLCSIEAKRTAGR